MYCPCSGYTIGDVPFSVFQCHSILCEHKAFQFYIVALIINSAFHAFDMQIQVSPERIKRFPFFFSPTIKNIFITYCFFYLFTLSLQITGLSMSGSNVWKTGCPAMSFCELFTNQSNIMKKFLLLLFCISTAIVSCSTLIIKLSFVPS